MKAPFPWFGGKSGVASLIWERFGDVPNYVEPFAGSLAVLLDRPTAPRVETVNDKDCHLANFWRAVQADPEAVAKHADWPVIECDLEARRKWVFESHDADEFRARMWSNPDFYDAKMAGWWVWGVCSTIGNNWKPRSLHLGDAGMGIHRPGLHLGDAGMGILAYFEALTERLRRVRVKCGEWDSVLSYTVLDHMGMTGLLLDPPYDSDCATDVYSHNESIGGAVAAWAREAGENHNLRIALCGYEGDHDMPGWECVPWKARGGYGSQSDGRGRKNAGRERIWFSPACIQTDLFQGVEP